MTLLLTLFTIVLLLAILLFTVNSKINLVFDSANSDIHLTLLWLYPFLRSVVTREGNDFALTVYLFNKKILKKLIPRKRSASGNKGILRNLKPTDIYVDTRYGFRDPFVTGLTCSAITMVSELFNVESLRMRPDFLATNDYISLDATAKLNLGNSLLKLI